MIVELVLVALAGVAGYGYRSGIALAEAKIDAAVKAAAEADLADAKSELSKLKAAIVAKALGAEKKV